MKRLACLALLLIALPATAQQRTDATFGYRRQLEQRLLALEQRHADLQSQLLAQRSQPAPAPQIIVVPVPQGAPPLQVLPVDPAPRQVLPIDPRPRQDLPVEPRPRQDLPVEPQPRQQLPLEPAPRQQLPIGPPKQVLPDSTKPAPIMPPAPPTGYQQYSIGPRPRVGEHVEWVPRIKTYHNAAR